MSRVQGLHGLRILHLGLLSSFTDPSDNPLGTTLLDETLQEGLCPSVSILSQRQVLWRRFILTTDSNLPAKFSPTDVTSAATIPQRAAWRYK
jgi:hypothetical protein